MAALTFELYARHHCRRGDAEPFVFGSKPLGGDLALGEGRSVYAPTLEGFVSKKREHFVAGRACLREALKDAGCRFDHWAPYKADYPPEMPPGFVGSITHGGDWALAICVPRSLDEVFLGVDWEPHPPIERARKLWSRVIDDEEASRLPSLEVSRAFSFVFSAKEALYKAFSPKALGALGFDAAKLIEAAAEGDEYRVTYRLDAKNWGPRDGSTVVLRARSLDEGAAALVVGEW